MRYALGIEYDGSQFLGWQTQRQQPTVQHTLEQVLASVADQPVRLHCAGRTDTGVHALGQVAHFDSSAQRSERSWVLGSNSRLPATVSVLWAKTVDESFHARFSAFARSYRYVILNRPVRPAVAAGKVTWCREPLNADAMHQAAQALLGEHDFSAFRSSGCSANHPQREVLAIAVRREKEQVLLEVSANGFLYHMVRNIVGSLLEVGKGARDPSWLAQLLAARDRRLAGVTAGSDGLYFLGARYPAAFGLPEPALNAKQAIEA
jgi:tRNA pseudouridine38-40 synthase